MAELPDDLFEMLLDAGVNSSKALAQVAKALKEDDPFAHDDERCPHCGGRLRRRLQCEQESAGRHRPMARTKEPLTRRLVLGFQQQVDEPADCRSRRSVPVTTISPPHSRTVARSAPVAHTSCAHRG